MLTRRIGPVSWRVRGQRRNATNAAPRSAINDKKSRGHQGMIDSLRQSWRANKNAPPATRIKMIPEGRRLYCAAANQPSGSCALRDEGTPCTLANGANETYRGAEREVRSAVLEGQALNARRDSPDRPFCALVEGTKGEAFVRHRRLHP